MAQNSTQDIASIVRKYWKHAAVGTAVLAAMTSLFIIGTKQDKIDYGYPKYWLDPVAPTEKTYPGHGSIIKASVHEYDSSNGIPAACYICGDGTHIVQIPNEILGEESTNAGVMGYMILERPGTDAYNRRLKIYNSLKAGIVPDERTDRIIRMVREAFRIRQHDEE